MFASEQERLTFFSLWDSSLLLGGDTSYSLRIVHGTDHYTCFGGIYAHGLIYGEVLHEWEK